MSDRAHLDETPRAASLMVALCAANGDAIGAELQLVELIAWLAFHENARAPGVVLAYSSKPLALRKR